MEISVLDYNKKQGVLTFVLSNSNPAFANMLRKTIIEEVPTLAIEDVEIRKNTSILYDEMLAHRLGLIPLKTDLDTYVLPEKCTCKGEGCAKCTLSLTLKAKGPGVVYASEIESSDPKIVPVFPKTPIVKLIKGQQVELVATAVVGRGIVHAKWSPGHCFYKYKPQIEIGKDIKNADEIAKSCPVNVFDVKGNKLSINKENLIKCHLCGACSDLSPEIKMNELDSEFVFTVESWGQLTPKEMVSQAITLFQEKIDELMKLFK